MRRRDLLLALPLLVFAGGSVRAEALHAPDGLAIGGYDAVAYFAQGRARRGNPAHFHDWNGARWLFASEAHRAAFAADPARHAPRYGGWCAYGMARGYKAPVDPEAWTVADGKLYLNYSRWIRRLWLADMTGQVAKADANWPLL
ncbi:MAG: YHS domain protein [Proteobacteria bacterium]|nr:YHS domain protein [Pseudomonadota bacterium]